MPHLNIEAEVEKLKGSALTEADKAELEKRLHYVKLWLTEYAPESYKFAVNEEIPDCAYDLSSEQKNFLNEIAQVLTSQNLSGEELHGKIHELRKASTLQAREGFMAIYAALIGKDSGPQAGWFLDALDQKFVIDRFTEVANLPEREKVVIEDVKGDLCEIKADVLEKFPAIKVMWAEIEDVKIVKNDAELEKIKQEILAEIDAEDLKKNSPISAEFKAMYKAFGVDPSKRKSSSVALIDRIANGKDLYNVNTLVDIYNLISIKYQLPFGAFDMSKLALPVVLKFANKGEKFVDMADEKEKILDDGELIYSDKNDTVIARDFNHRDSLLTKITDSTTHLLLQVDGNSQSDDEYVQQAFEEALALVLRFCGGRLVKKEFLKSN